MRRSYPTLLPWRPRWSIRVDLFCIQIPYTICPVDRRPRGGNEMEIRSLLTVAVLAVTLAGPASAEESYKRPRWSHPEHTCRDTRAMVLVQRCRFVEMDARGCHVKR